MHSCDGSRDVVLETAVLVSRALETNFMRSWSWSWYLWSWSRLEGWVSKRFKTSCVRHLCTVCIVRCSHISNWRLHYQMPLSRTSSAMSSLSLYVILWAWCTAFQQPPPQWRESLAMVASSPHGTRDWWCIVWLGICEMQCCFVNTLTSVDSWLIHCLLSSFAV